MFWVVARVARWLLGCSGWVARAVARVFWVVARVLLGSCYGVLGGC